MIVPALLIAQTLAIAAAVLVYAPGWLIAIIGCICLCLGFLALCALISAPRLIRDEQERFEAGGELNGR